MVIGGWWIYRLKGWSFENAVRFARLTLYAWRFALNAWRFARLTLNAWRFVPMCLFVFPIPSCLLPLPLLCASVPFCIHYCLFPIPSCLLPLPYCLLPLPLLFPPFLCPIFINFATLNFTCWQQNHHFSNALGIVGIRNRR